MCTSGTITPGVQVCSLKVDTPQLIPADGDYHILRFPYGAPEPSDRFNMHQMVQPDGYSVADWSTDDRSGLIWPSRYGWGHLYGMIQWESGAYTELRDQYVRDPLLLGSPTPNDTTATEHRSPTPGMQCYVKGHGIYVNSDTPLALRVAHNDTVPRNVVLAEFKVCIHPAE